MFLMKIWFEKVAEQFLVKGQKLCVCIHVLSQKKIERFE